MQWSGVDARRLAQLQGALYVGSGLWPLVHLRSFEALSGPRGEGPRVRRLGALMAGVGAVLLQGARRERVTPVLRRVAVSSALVLAAVDVAYARAGRHRVAVFALDAALQLALVGAWVLHA